MDSADKAAAEITRRTPELMHAMTPEGQAQRAAIIREHFQADKAAIHSEASRQHADRIKTIETRIATLTSSPPWP